MREEANAREFGNALFASWRKVSQETIFVECFDPPHLVLSSRQSFDFHCLRVQCRQTFDTTGTDPKHGSLSGCRFYSLCCRSCSSFSVVIFKLTVIETPSAEIRRLNSRCFRMSQILNVSSHSVLTRIILTHLSQTAQPVKTFCLPCCLGHLRFTIRHLLQQCVPRCQPP